MRGGSTVDNKAKNRSISEWLSSLIKFNSPDTIQSFLFLTEKIMASSKPQTGYFH